MKKLTKVLGLLLACVLAFGLFSCGESPKEETPVTPSKALDAYLLGSDGNVVSADFTLPVTVAGCEVTWTSSDPCITLTKREATESTEADYLATVGVPATTTTVTLTVTAQDGSSKEFHLIVRAKDVDDVADKYKFAYNKRTISEPITLDTSIEAFGMTATITWSVPEEFAEFAKVEDGKLVGTAEEETAIKVIATFTVGEQSTKRTYKLNVASSGLKCEVVAEPQDGQTYYWGLFQVSLGKQLYFNGKMDGVRLATTDKPYEAVQVTVEKFADEDKYYLTFMDGETKKYIEIYEYQAGKKSQQITETPTTYWEWNAELGRFVTKLTDEAYYFLGTYSSYNTISASAITYITGENAANVGVTQFCTDFYKLTTTKLTLKEVAAPQDGQTYYWGLFQTSLGKQLYFNGKMDSVRLATTDNFDEAVQVTVEKFADEDKYYLTFMDGETKKYIEIYEYQAGKKSQQITETPTTYWEWNAELGRFVTKLTDEAYYFLGTYSTYNTISASAITYITGENAANVGVTQFCASFYQALVTTLVCDTVAEPQVGQSYAWGLFQTSLGKQLFFNGKMDGVRLATTEDVREAVIVTIEAGSEDGTYRLSFMDGETKKYIEIYEYQAGKKSQQVTETPTTNWEWNAELGRFVTKLSDEAYYFLGTYSTYNTISASAITYITGENAANVGVTQFCTDFYLIMR